MRLLSLSSRLLIDEQKTNLFRRCPDCRRLVNVLAIAPLIVCSHLHCCTAGYFIGVGCASMLL